jgi:2-phosphoglycerate kinase
MTVDDLAHVIWIGGSACAGKTTLARSLAARDGLALYSCDDRFEDHRRRAGPARHPRFHRVMDLPPNRLFAPPAAARAEEILGFYRDEFEMVIEDLRALPGPAMPAVIEGVGLLPDLVAAICPDPSRSLWRIATPAFRRRIYAQRGDLVRQTLAGLPDPDSAFEVWMERDDLIARYLEEEARRLGLRVEIVD